MRRVWRLGVVVGLLAAAWGVLVFFPHASDRDGATRLYGLSAAVSGWKVIEGVPEWALPPDPNEKLAVRRTYQSGQRQVWASVALFGRQDLPERRASLNLLYQEKGTTRIERFGLPVALNGSPDHPLSLPAVYVHREQQRLAVIYWYQLGPNLYASEYRYRLALLRAALLERRTDMVLVRLATVVGAGENPEDALTALRTIAPSLYAQIRASLGR